jgi:hypothetical protein
MLNEIFNEFDFINENINSTNIPKTIQGAYVFYKYIYYYYTDYLKSNDNKLDNVNIYDKVINDINEFMVENTNNNITIVGGAKRKTNTKKETDVIENIKTGIKQVCDDNDIGIQDIIDKIELLFKIINKFRNEKWIVLSKSNDFRASSVSIDKINSLFNKIISPERMNIAYGNYKQVLDMVKYPYDKIRDESFRKENYNKLEYIGTETNFTINVQIPPEYKNFAYNTLTLFKRPQRETTNAALQNLINSFESNTTAELYSFLEKAYMFYMRNNEEYKLSNDETKLLNIGLNYINTNITERGIRREIYIMSDFIEGLINDNDVNRIYCPFIGQHLGNELRFLVRMTQGGKINNKDINFWAVDRNRMIFSLKTLEMTALSFDKEKELKATEMKPDMYYQKNVSTNAKNIEMIPFNKDEEKQKQQDSTDFTGIDSWFYSEIINSNDKELEKIINELNYYGISTIVLRDIFDNIIKKTELYNIVKPWFLNKYKYSAELISNMIMLSSKYDGKIKDIANKMEEQKNKLNTEALNKLNYEYKFYTLLKTLVEKLIINEKNKNQLITSTITGGNNNSRKNKKMNLNNITRRK